MNHYKFLLMLLFFVFKTGFSQEIIVKHIVLRGETISQIAQKYNVTTADIFKLNPDAQSGLKPKMILLISSAENGKLVSKTHLVASNETVFGLAKTYNTTVEVLENANPSIAKDGLKIGDLIIIPNLTSYRKNETAAAKTDKNPDSRQNNSVLNDNTIHLVEGKETKYSIAKLYNISIEELEAANPEIKDVLQIGFRLKIVENSALRKSVKKEIVKVEILKTEISSKKEDSLEYIVKPQETLYSLTKKFGMDQNELFHLNPELKNGVKVGMKLQFPSDVIINENLEKSVTVFSQSPFSLTRKKMVLLLPFNLSVLEKDTVNTIAARLKKDKFLNMTLDFYSGALMAIDSAKTIGLNINITILDSQETKNSSNIENLIQQNQLQQADVIIGPFYQSNVEKAAELLLKSKAIVISPLSKETSKNYQNLILATPSNEVLKEAMFDYMNSKSGNIVAIIDPKKGASKKYIQQNQKQVKFVGMNAKGGFSMDSIVSKLAKNRINYIVLDSEKTGIILKTINFLTSLMSTYQLQLVILEKNETLDFEEISLAKIAKLKMLYPSTINENSDPASVIFDKDFRSINKILPNQFASRGFDLTFDTLLRLSQEKSFIETVEKDSTEQIENKFDYQKKKNESWVNKGVYILYYDTDLSVKIAQ